jgi:signal transduction histidine kinase
MDTQEKIINDEQSETFCLHELKTELKTYVEQELEKMGKTEVKVEIFKDYHPEKIQIHADRKCLREILTILLDNAVKHTDKGCILFDYNISIISPVQDTVGFFVDDTGDGVYDENDPNLALANELVAQMGGELEVRPAGKAGTSVSFNIACAPFEVPGN